MGSTGDQLNLRPSTVILAEILNYHLPFARKILASDDPRSMWSTNMHVFSGDTAALAYLRKGRSASRGLDEQAHIDAWVTTFPSMVDAGADAACEAFSSVSEWVCEHLMPDDEVFEIRRGLESAARKALEPALPALADAFVIGRLEMRATYDPESLIADGKLDEWDEAEYWRLALGTLSDVAAKVKRGESVPGLGRFAERQGWPTLEYYKSLADQAARVITMMPRVDRLVRQVAGRSHRAQTARPQPLKAVVNTVLLDAFDFGLSQAAFLEAKRGRYE